MTRIMLRFAALPVIAQLPLIFAGNLAIVTLAWILAMGLEAAAGAGAAAFALALAAAASLLAMAVTGYALALPDESHGWRPEALRRPGPMLTAALLAPLALGLAACSWELWSLSMDGPPAVRLLAAMGLGGLLPLLLFLAYLLPAAMAGGDGPVWRRSGLMVFRHGAFAFGTAMLALGVLVLSAGLLPGIGGALLLLRAATRRRLNGQERS